MKHHHRETFRRNLQFLLFLAMTVLFTAQLLWSVIVVQKLKDPTLIAIDSNGTRLVTGTTDPIFKTEGLAFVQKFFASLYNFDSTTFLKQVGFASNLMSENLWKKKESEIRDLAEKVKRESIAVSGVVEKITRDETGHYHGLVRLSEKSRLKEGSHLLKVELRLSQVPRSQNNPFGLEVDFYEETLLSHQ